MPSACPHGTPAELPWGPRLSSHSFSYQHEPAGKPVFNSVCWATCGYAAQHCPQLRRHINRTAECNAGHMRLLRLMHKLRVTEVERHAELLLAICAGSPSMAAAYLAACGLALEPRGGSPRWLVGITLVGQLVQSAAQAASPCTQLIEGYGTSGLEVRLG